MRFSAKKFAQCIFSSVVSLKQWGAIFPGGINNEVSFFTMAAA